MDSRPPPFPISFEAPENVQDGPAVSKVEEEVPCSGSFPFSVGPLSGFSATGMENLVALDPGATGKSPCSKWLNCQTARLPLRSPILRVRVSNLGMTGA